MSTTDTPPSDSGSFTALGWPVLMAGAALLAACGNNEAAREASITTAPLAAERAGARAAASNDGWTELKGDEAKAAAELIQQAEEAWRDKRTGAQIARAIDAYRTGGGRRGYFDRADSPYRPSEFGQITNLPADAAASGITGAAGLVLDARDGPYRSVLVSYLVFDDPAAARVYLDNLDRNFNQSMTQYETIDLTREPGSPIEVRCVFVPDANNAVNCHHAGPPDDRVVAVLLFADGPPLNFRSGKRAIDLVFANEAADQRVRDAVAEAAAYLADAVR